MPTEVLNRVTQQAVDEIVGRIADHFESRPEAYLQAGQEFERRRQFTLAIDEYVNCAMSAELRQKGEQFAALAQARAEDLIRQ